MKALTDFQSRVLIDIAHGDTGVQIREPTKNALVKLGYVVREVIPGVTNGSRVRITEEGKKYCNMVGALTRPSEHAVMKQWHVRYRHNKSGRLVGYIVVAEDADIAAVVGLESIEHDESIAIDNNPDNWRLHDSSLIEVCRYCGGLRRATDPKGEGHVQ